MKSGGLFSTTISCGALAGIFAGAVWVALVVASLRSPPATISAYFFEEAFRAGLALAPVLCAPAIYYRRLSLTVFAMGYAIVLVIETLVCAHATLWLVQRWVTSGNWTTLWNVFDLVFIVALCPLLGGSTGYFLSRLYGIPHLSLRLTAFGILGCALHLVVGIASVAGRFAKLNLDSPDVMALHTMLAIMGYVYLGAITGVPVDSYFRSRDIVIADGE